MSAVKKVLVYVEGEGGGGTPSKRKFQDGEFRRAWRQFLEPLIKRAAEKGVEHFQCVAGRGGASTSEKFGNPLPQQKGALRILLIDSERPVDDIFKPWNEINKRPPNWADDGNCYLMVQCLETWLLADPESLRKHYNSKGKGCFRDNKLKAWSNLEEIPRLTLLEALESATADCGKPYSHADGNVLIAIVCRDRLQKLRSVARLFKDLAQRIDDYANE